MGQFHFDPETYDALMASDVPAYARLQAAVAAAANDARADGAKAAAGTTASSPTPPRLLETGTGTGETAVRILVAYPGATLVGVDVSEAMLEHARRRLPAADLRVARLQDPLPDGPFDLVFSALAVHHLDAAEKSSLFARVAEVLAPGGRFVLGDLIVPDDLADVVTPIDGVFDLPVSIADQLAWMEDASLQAEVAWRERDLAVLVGL